MPHQTPLKKLNLFKMIKEDSDPHHHCGGKLVIRSNILRYSSTN